MSELILSAFADEYSEVFDEQLEALKNFDVRYIELRFVDGKNISELTEGEVERVKAKLEKAGIRVSSIGSPLGKIKIDGDIEGHLALAERVFKTANTLGAKYVRVFSFYPAENRSVKEDEEKVFSVMEKMLSLAEKYGVVLCHENEAKIYGESPEECKRLLDYFGGRLRAVFDMGNFAFEGYDPLSAYELLRDYVEYFHIKDALKASAIVPAGKGEAKIEEILAKYRKDGGKDTFVTLEPHLETFSGLNRIAVSSFETPYKYENQKLAFTDGYNKFKEILERI